MAKSKVDAISLKEYISFLDDEFDIILNKKNRENHILSYLKFSYDFMLGHKVEKEYHDHLINLMKDLKISFSQSANQVYQASDKCASEVTKILDLREETIRIFPPATIDSLWTYTNTMKDDPWFNEITFYFLKFYSSIKTIDMKGDKLSTDEYVYLTKLVNSSVGNWIDELKEVTIQFNLIVRNVYKLLPSKFLKIH